MAIWFVLMLAAYLLGSVPASYLLAKLYGGIDLRRYGTGQLGGGNLYRMTSWRLALPVGIFDVSKGLVMVWVAKLLGLEIAQQLAVGLAAIIGHNWPVFLRFSGGRGIGTAMGVIFILPFLNEMTPWVAVAFFTILVIVTLVMRSSPVAVLFGMAAMPVVSWGFGEPLAVTLSFLAVFLVIVTRRLTAPGPVETISRRRRLLNRLLFDRDIRDRKGWMYRTPSEGSTVEKPEPEKG